MSASEDVTSSDDSESSVDDSEKQSNSLVDVSQGRAAAPGPSAANQNEAFRSRFEANIRAGHLARNRDEVDLANSLDSLEAEDLSIHLYNIHAWKRRVRQQRESNKVRDDEDQLESAQTTAEEWQPRRSWTDWPLPPHRVPRPRERFTQYEEILDGDGLIKPQVKAREKPSDELESCLLGEILSQSRKRFYSETADEQVEQAEGHAGPSIKKLKRQQKDTGAIHTHQAIQESTSAEFLQSGRDFSNENDTSLLGSSINKDHEVHNEGTSTASHSTAREKATATRRANLQPPPLTSPEIMKDEEEARRIAQPAIRHVLAKLDKLLMTLHISYFNPLYHFRTPGLVVDPTTSLPEASRLQKSLIRSRIVRTTKIRRRYRPKDWSNVVGFAALAGFDGDVVRKVASRCSRLFGESMDFRVLHEDNINPNSTRSSSSTDNGSSSSDSDTHIGDTSNQLDTTEPLISQSESDDLIKCPVPGCDRTFTRTWRLVGHVVRKHRLDAMDARPLQPEYLRYLACPFRECSGSNTNWPNLRAFKNHLRNHHKIDHADINNEALQQAMQEAAIRSKENDEVFGGVHVDGFLKPIRVLTRWTRFKVIPQFGDDRQKKNKKTSATSSKQEQKNKHDIEAAET